MEKLWKEDGVSCVFVNLFEFASERIDDEWENLSFCESRKDNQHSTELRMKGNVKLRLELWNDAMDLFNQSLCFAETNSENAARALANRSECFFRMGKYQEALIDIELAKGSNISNRLMSKLDRIQQKLMASQKASTKSEKNEKCEIDTSDQLSKVEIKLSFASHTNYPCMANVLDIKTNAKFGRHLVANCDIPVGQTVLIERDFLSMRSDDELVCSTCSRSKMNFIACTNCTDAVYCNEECMKQNLTHKWECGTVFAQLHHRMRFQIQAILLAIETFGTVERLMEFVENVLLEDPDSVPSSLDNAQMKYHFFFKLNKSAPFLPQYLPKIHQIYENILMLPKIRILFDTDGKQRFLMHLVLHHFLVIKTNSIISKSPWSTISVFNILSMLNHCCAPNVYHPRRENQQHCVTIRPIRSGEQLFISYLPLNNELSSEERNGKFTSSWGFSCTCELCHQIQKPTDPDLITSDSCFEFIVENFNIENNRKNLPILMENCTKFLNRFGNSQWSTEILMVVSIFAVLYIEMLSRWIS